LKIWSDDQRCWKEIAHCRRPWSCFRGHVAVNGQSRYECQLGGRRHGKEIVRCTRSRWCCRGPVAVEGQSRSECQLGGRQPMDCSSQCCHMWLFWNCENLAGTPAHQRQCAEPKWVHSLFI